MQAHELRDAGLGALRAGNARKAREYFEQLTSAGGADVSIWSALAVACHQLGDRAGMISAIDGVLAIDPRNIPALIMKGDALALIDKRAAVSYYGTAVKLASHTPNLPADMQRSVERAAAARDRINKDIESHLRRHLADAGYDPTRSSKRFTHSLDLLGGRKQPYYQEPRAYLFPELPQIQFYPREACQWLDAIEAATDEIRAELLAVLENGSENFVPYIQAPVAGPARAHNLLDNPDWSAFFLWKDGAPVPGNAARCPKTLAAVQRAPLGYIENRTPSILFSLLRPDARIEPHHGFLNTRLICHLPLIAPPGCFLRVGNDVREWQPGKAWVFDDTIEHEAWNSSGETRVVLIFDIWRPELTEEERCLVSALLHAVDTYEGAQFTSWRD